MGGAGLASRWPILPVPTTRNTVTLMHRDTKLGLALAILVMGFAAALCFPRESGENHSDLSLQMADGLDQAIGRTPVKVYSDTDRPQRLVTEEIPIHLEPAETSPQEVFPLVGVQDATQPPRDPEPTPVDSENLPPDTDSEPAPEPVVHTRTYQVRPNDTLSAIATREMGDHRLADQLFEANRHLLVEKDKLPLNLELVIPIPAGEEVVSTPQAGSSPGSSMAPAAPTLPLRTEATPNRASGRFGLPRTRVGSSGSSSTPR